MRQLRHSRRHRLREARGERPSGEAHVLENVPGLVAGAMRFVFAEMLRAIRDAGYDVAARRLNAMHYSVPHARTRSARHDPSFNPG